MMTLNNEVQDGDKISRQCGSGICRCHQVILATFLVFTASALQTAATQNCESLIIRASTDTNGSLTSPGYPISLLNRVHCTWTIKTGPNNNIIIRFHDVDIEDDDNCTVAHCCRYNSLQIGSSRGDDSHIYCGRDLTPDTLKLSAQKVWIKYHLSRDTPGRGFNLTYFIKSQKLCASNSFRCATGQCIEISQQCNGINDCGDHSDERNCSHQSKHLPGICPPDMTWCENPNGDCFFNSQRCDRIFDCPNGKDEISCVNTCQDKIQCHSGNGCYDWKERCNGVTHCNDYSDEKNCGPDTCRSGNGGFLCNNLRCIRESWQCDQTNDCGDNSDELNCIKNSVITAAVMGSLICGLLLVIAVGCTCKLYTLRLRDNRLSQCVSNASCIDRERLEQELPPSYTMAINDPSAHFFQQAHGGWLGSHCYSSRIRLGRRIRRLRRHRRRPPTPPPQSLAPLHQSNSCPDSNPISCVEDNSLPRNYLEPNSDVEIAACSLHSQVIPAPQETTIVSCLHRLASFGKIRQTILSSNLHSLTLMNPINDSDQGSISSEQSTFGEASTSTSTSRGVIDSDSPTPRHESCVDLQSQETLENLTSEMEDDQVLLLCPKL